MGARPSEDTRRSDARSGIDSIRSCSECAASFCDPRQSRQKAHAKHCYEKLCKILSKGGANFNVLTRRDIAVCMRNVNNYLCRGMDLMGSGRLGAYILYFT